MNQNKLADTDTGLHKATAAHDESLNGAWQEVKGKLKQRWGDLSDDELTEMQGNVEQLTGYLLRKTGETREAIEEYLQQMGVYEAWQQAADNVSQWAHSTSQAMQQSAQDVSEQVRAGYIQTQRMVQRRPMESLAVTFGFGLAAGIITGLLLRSRNH